MCSDTALLSGILPRIRNDEDVRDGFAHLGLHAVHELLAWENPEIVFANKHGARKHRSILYYLRMPSYV